jgi:nicotinic acid phosphoribosyltransferase
MSGCGMNFFNTLGNYLPISVLTDSYKAGHFAQYPEANLMVAYGEFRKYYEGLPDDHRLVWFGIRYIVENYLYRKWTQDDVDKAQKFYKTHNAGNTEYPFPYELYSKIVKENDGYFPIKLEALPEGSVIYPHVPVYQISAKGEFSRLTTFMETLLTMVIKIFNK